MGKHLLGCQDLSIEEIKSILNKAQYFLENNDNLFSYREAYRDKFVVNLFLEPSTRTRFSFEVAEKKLGIQVLNFESNISSLQKGESLYDTLKTFEAQGMDIVVIRLREEGILQHFSRRLNLSIINAGEGKKAHPTQALLDLFTIKQYFNDLKGLNVAIIGDIAHSRVARSNYYLLKKFGANIFFSGPPNLMAPDLENNYLPIDEAIRRADVVMMLRIQAERHSDNKIKSKEAIVEYNRKFGFTEERLQYLQSHAIILHPAPVNRGVEMDDIVVDHQQSKIFEQIHNGVWVRMAILDRALGVN
ncbi:aspartate carbamoyltransferase [Vulcanibacillus modesticaldus]|uniref:Aspartate carbamoyltransferase n=1 Tax=Vulcanibacillus modesticaldus TaxID=337097 RepID=A0A1D2YTS2_9BACI|nr:aspartate carbamoyltransferase catalytic subunit [Vulcanibacillus modesticaldus]OEF99103.1 aspartate carbamoyltransferase [Vulcanibacillus modesticaldus]